MKSIVEKQRTTPFNKECEVLVAGGGIAGIAAAIAAARRGAKVILVEKQCALGGLATLGMIIIYLPLCDGMGNQVVFGIGEELLKLSIQYGHDGRYPKAWLEGGSLEEKKKQRYLVQYNPYLFAISAEQLLISEGVEILYDTHITGINGNGGRINSVIIDNKEGHWAIKVETVIDATGDADICMFAGEQTETFTHNRYAAWHYLFENSGVKLNQLSVPINGSLPDGSRTYNGVLTDDISSIIIDGHSGILNKMLEKRREANTEDIVPVSIPLVPLCRMTRRLKGVYELDESEERKKFDDSIGMTGDWRKVGPVFNIPFSCLYGDKVDNLITAGRCISVTTSMWDITRVIPTCAVTGEAAGAAAAQMVKNKVSAYKDININNLQETLRQNGVVINREITKEMFNYV